MKRWKFGVAQTHTDEKKEIEGARAAGLEVQYMQGQVWSRTIEAETERRRARHGSQGKRTEPVPDSELPGVFPSPEEVEAARSGRGGWTRETLARWGVPWPPPKSWRGELERQRHGGPRPRGWSGPVEARRPE